METRRIGSLEVSAVGLGCNNFGTALDADGTAEVVDAAIEAGITLFDTADIYGKGRSETFLGQALKGRRDEVVLATKFGMDMGDGNVGAHPDYVRKACDASLSRLGVDVIDLYQLHKPDDAVPMEDTLGALQELVQAGKVREIGGSNFSVEQIQSSEATSKAKGWARYVSIQNHYSLVERDPDNGVLEACEQLGIGFLPYFPLASGLLTGKYRGGNKPEGARLSGGGRMSGSFLGDRNVAIAEALGDFAEGQGHTLLELAVSWLLTRPAVSSVIAGATKVAQVKGNVAAAGWSLTADELAEVDRLAPVAAG